MASTPPWFAERALKLWPNGRQVIIPRSGQQLDTSCEFGMIEAFIRAGSAPTSTRLVSNKRSVQPLF
jgi:hypothetical protein